MKFLGSGFLLFSGLFCFMTTIEATSLDTLTTEQMVQRANLIFEGVVTSVAYRHSDVDSADHERIPHTFVTYRIERLFKGRSEKNNTITLRFQGGPTGKDEVVFIPGIPLFDIGDRDILFVERNGESWCPLVGWDQGRHRIINGMVFSDDGHELWATQQGRLVNGPLFLSEEVTKNKIGNSIFEFDVVGTGTPAIPKGGTKMYMEEYRTFLADRIRKTHSEQGLRMVKPEKSVSVRERFHEPRLKALPAPNHSSSDK